MFEIRDKVKYINLYNSKIPKHFTIDDILNKLKFC